MSLFQILSQVAEAVLPLVMLVNGFGLGFVLGEERAERRAKRAAAANAKDFPGHDGPEHKPKQKETL